MENIKEKTIALIDNLKSVCQYTVWEMMVMNIKLSRKYSCISF